MLGAGVYRVAMQDRRVDTVPKLTAPTNGSANGIRLESIENV